MSSASTTRSTRAMILCTVATAGVGGVAAQDASAQDPSRLPVYDVRSTGATSGQAKQLAKALGLSARMLGENGLLTYMDAGRFGALPTKPVTAAGATQPNEEGRPVVAEAPDLEAIRQIKPLSAATARRRATAALKAARLTGGTAKVTNSEFESYDAHGALNAKVAVDTHVSFPASLGKQSLIGPGSKSKIVFGADGTPTYVRFARRTLAQGKTTALLAPAAADRLATQRLQSGCPGKQPLSGLRLSRRLVYYAPPLSLRSVKRIVPHYDYGASATVAGRRVELERVLVPAVRAGAPRATLSVSAGGGRVSAATKVAGGTAPYTYSYSSCATTLPDAARSGAKTSYSVERRPGSRGPVAERLSVVVTDANGLMTTASAAVTVAAPSTGAIGALRARAAITGRVDVGNEWIGNSQGLPNSEANNYDFRDEMSDVATIAFWWSDNNVFESDFTEPAAGNDTNWADNVDLMWFQGHGNPDGFTTGADQGDGWVDRSETRWGNNDLEWLVVHSCKVLKRGSGATNVWNRWSPAFRGLHLLLGYGNNSYNVDGDGNEFGDDLADDDMKIRSAWADANESYQPDDVIYRYMGVYGPNGEWNREDYFHGIGPVSADITTVTGAWSYSGTV